MINQLIESAFLAYRSPNRTQYVFNQSVGTNLDAVCYYLKQANNLDPNQTALKLTLANIYSFQGEIAQAVRIYQGCFTHENQTSETITALCYLIVWHHYLAEHKRVEYYLQHLMQKSPSITTQVKQLLSVLEYILAKPINYEVEALSRNACTAIPDSLHQPKPAINVTQAQHSAIVILGYKLNSDGSIPAMLLQRLNTALTVIKAWPQSPIFVTGGLAQAGVTEARAMQQWLIAHHIPADRIILEDKATNTLDNASFTLTKLQQHKIHQAWLISASIHVHRSEIIFASTQLRQQQLKYQYKSNQNNKQPTFIQFNHYSARDGLSSQPQPEGKVRLDCYIDALRSFGLPAFCTTHFTQD